MVARSIARALHRWMAWKAKRRLYSALPSFRELDARQAAYAARHRSGGREIAIQKRRLMTARLAFECGRR